MIDICLISGAGGGIGSAIALDLAQRGVEVVLLGRAATITPVLQQIQKAGSLAESLIVDFGEPAKVKKSVESFLKHRSLNKTGIVLCASTLGSASGSIESELAEFEQVFRVNLVGNLAVLQACMPRLLQVGFGRVVFFAGGGAAYAYPLFSAYSLSKVCTVRLVENLAVECPPSTGLSFVAMAPGAVATPMLEKVEAAGGEVRTRVDISEPVNFVSEYLASESNSLSGRFFHVRDEWRRVLAGEKTLKEDQWLLRRVP